MKKVVNSVLASALALSVAPMAVGAEEAQDQQLDSKLQSTINRLQALELVKGDDKGNLNLDNEITRAEFATLVVRARGLASGVPLAKYQTKFSDVQVSDWYSGWINVASGEGLVKGYPNNTFGPNNNVTYAEAATMLVRALGYEPAVSSADWPNNFIAKAAELGISDGVMIDPNKPATRKDVFMMLDNSLSVDLMKQVTYGTQVEYKAVPGTSLVEDYLNVTVYDTDWYTQDDVDNRYDADDLPFVVGVPAVELGKLKEDEVILKSSVAGGLQGTYKVANGINPNEFAGQHVQVWVKDGSDVILWMEGSRDEEVLRTSFDSFSYDGDDIDGDTDLDILDDLDELRVELDGRKYEFANNAVFVYNYQSFGNDWEEFVETVLEHSDVDGMSTKAVLNSEGQINYIHIVDDVQGDQDHDYKFGSEVIKEIDSEDKVIEFYDADDLDLEDLEEGEEFIVLRNGERASFSDLKPLDVVNVYYANGDDDKLIIVATSKTVEGKVEEVIIKKDTDTRLVINGETYRMRGDVTLSDDDNESADVATQDEIQDLDGEEVTLYLDASGRVRHILAGEAGEDNTVKAVVVKDGYYDDARDELIFDVFTEKGAKISNVKITDPDDIDFDEAVEDLDPDSDNLADYEDLFDITSSKTPIFVELELDDDGDVESVTLLDSGKPLDAADFEDESDEDTLEGDDITDSTVVFDLTGAVKQSGSRDYIDSPKLSKWSYVEGEQHEVYYVSDNGDVEYVFVISGSITSSGQIGYVKEFTRSGGDHYAVIINEDGEEKKYKLDDEVNDARKIFKENDVIYFELNGSDELALDSVERIVNSHSSKIDVGVEIDDRSEVDYVVAARVVDLDGSELVVEVADEDGDTVEEEYVVSSSTVYVSLDDNEKVKKVNDDDLVILIDTDDSSDKVDFVLIVDTDDFSDEEIEEFLKQTPQSGGGDDEEPQPGDDLLDLDKVQGKRIEFFGSYLYSITGEVGAVDPDATVTVTLGGQTKTATFNEDGSFKAEFGLSGQYSTATINVELNGEEKEYTVDIQG
ncbi:MAG: S-layer homology domain-containing protein [Brevibacillus sp.]|nr:S-layer homology domain-containing protein [Brevibacillus sp.]